MNPGTGPHPLRLLSARRCRGCRRTPEPGSGPFWANAAPGATEPTRRAEAEDDRAGDASSRTSSASAPSRVRGRSGDPRGHRQPFEQRTDTAIGTRSRAIATALPGGASRSEMGHVVVETDAPESIPEALGTRRNHRPAEAETLGKGSAYAKQPGAPGSPGPNISCHRVRPSRSSVVTQFSQGRRPRAWSFPFFPFTSTTRFVTETRIQ